MVGRDVFLDLGEDRGLVVDLDDLFDLAVDRPAEQFFDSHDSPRGMMRAR